MMVAGASLMAGTALADCPTWHVLQNGQTASATDVMDNFNRTLGCPNFTGNVGVGVAAPLAPVEIARNTGTGIEAPLLRLNAVDTQPNNGASILWTNVGDANALAKIAGQDAGGYGGMLTFSTKAPAGGTAGNPVERMRIDSYGRVGIGTAGPNAPLEISSDTGSATEAPLLRLNSVSGNTGNGGSILWVNNGDANQLARIYGADSGSWGGDLILATKANSTGPSGNTVERMRINNAGSVGIGVSAPWNMLHVRGGAPQIAVDGENQSSIMFRVQGGEAWDIGTDWSGQSIRNFFIFDAATRSVRLIVNPNGNVGIGTTAPATRLDVAGVVNASGGVTQSSDVRLKTDIQSLPDGAIGQVMHLRPVTFRWKAPKDDAMQGRQTGLIAQETEAVLPDAVLTAKDEAGTKSIKYNEVMVTMLKAVQEQQKEIAALKARVQQLEAQTGANGSAH
ncbi:tail fiber domain-containing protein [Azospirillum sp. B4]|uniref:tail fiber domain-containing protein n=1 Tax=Azospirillum sp. B4 TaxID=95605 RepID=UPI0003489473|nr:tail fiber domain-containing protein [Azospirillum sp. B4]